MPMLGTHSLYSAYAPCGMQTHHTRDVISNKIEPVNFKKSNIMNKSILIIIASFCFLQIDVYSQSIEKCDLNVALFAWLPDMALVFEQVEKDFENRYPEYNLEIEAIDPYSNEGYGIFNGINNFYDFDIVEIDYYRFNDLNRVNPSSLDSIPKQFVVNNDYVGGASKITNENLSFFVPHWICGNNLVYRTSNKQLDKAESFNEILESLNPKTTPLNVDFYGKATLGEYYADAVLDTYGENEARKHLKELGTNKNTKLKSDIVKKIKLLFEEINPKFRDKIEQFHDFSYLYPEDFYTEPRSVLLGYSERLFYVEKTKKETELIAWSEVKLESNDYQIKQFSFSDKSQGTPSWVDGFVIPAGKSKDKESAIATFLTYITSPKAYSVINKEQSYMPARYLLPAYKSAFQELSKKSPLILKYLNTQENIFLIDDESIYEGIRKAGKELSKEITKS